MAVEVVALAAVGPPVVDPLVAVARKAEPSIAMPSFHCHPLVVVQNQLAQVAVADSHPSWASRRQEERQNSEPVTAFEEPAGAEVAAAQNRRLEEAEVAGTERPYHYLGDFDLPYA